MINALRLLFFQERLLIADMAIASSEFMFEETRNYVTQRKAFGKTIAHLQVG
jgi:long-chain-acyl-CoA dehydrogenase